MTGNSFFNDKSGTGLPKWLPATVVALAVGSFVSLAWYSYSVSDRPAREDDLLVVEADKTPIKEKPTDAGGMQFPNQDKTVFETFSGTQLSEAKVERVLPAPEEPVSADNKTTTDNISATAPIPEMVDVTPKSSETLISPTLDKQSEKHQEKNSEKAADHVTDKPVELKTAEKPVEVAEVKIADVKKTVETSVVKENESAKKTDVKKSAPKKEDKKKSDKKTADKKTTTNGKPSSSVQVQLGAYQSDADAKSEWSKIRKKHPELAGKTPHVVKAAVGGKTYYRLRASGFASEQAAKVLCSSLSAKGQACIIAK